MPDTPTCAPPPEHQHLRWHWLMDTYNKLDVWRWEKGVWFNGAEYHHGSDLADYGYDYVAPCPEPEVPTDGLHR